jgi:mRNA interferase RelE/StbE
LAWTIDYTEQAQRALARLDRQVAQRIDDFLTQRVARLVDPRQISEPLLGPQFLRQFRYRVGDYRVICELIDERVTVLVVKIGHRREIYRP